MSNAKPLSISEVEKFFDRVKATIAAAEQSNELRRIIARFAGGAVPAGLTRGRAAAKAPRRTRKPGIPPAKVLEYMKSTKSQGPQSISDVAKGMKDRNDRVRSALLKLRDAKSVKMTGTRSLARWQAA